MSKNNGFTAPGSTVYSSDTMYVGDGTWDKEKNTFLLPNLQGLNFETMRYNGMGNRFRSQTQYYYLIQAHGILATIVFLFLIPFAILFLRFNSRRIAVRIHIWCQIMVVMLTTVLFILGFQAVGPSRSLTNPHHGIGVAIYVLVLFQFLLGWFVYSREKRRKLAFAPIKALLHRWFGRLIGILGLVQIPLGLTLYGSPKYLFILYSVVTFGWLAAYFVLSYINERNEGLGYGSDYSYGTGSVSGVGARRRSRFGKFAKAAVAGVGVGVLANKLRKRHETHESIGSASYSGAEEKMSAHHTSQHGGGGGGGFMKRILEIGAIGGAALFLKRIFGRKNHESDYGSDYYTESSMTGPRTDAEAASPNARRPLNAHASPGGRSDSYISDDDYSSASPSKHKTHGIRNTFLGLGALGAARSLFQKRKERKEDERLEELRQQDIESERIQRNASKRHGRYTGDGHPRPGYGGPSDQPPLGPVNPAATAAGLGAAGGLAAAALGHQPGQPQYPGQPAYHTPGPVGPAYGGTIDGQPLPVPPPPPHDPFQPSRAEMAVTGGSPAAAGMAAAAAGPRAKPEASSRRQSESPGNVATPPVSVKLNMHSDGRHVTLRRLTEEEAAADRAQRSGRNRRRRAESGSSMSAGEGPSGGRWRRDDDKQDHTSQERQQLQAQKARLNAPENFPPPPPIPGSADPQSSGLGSITSPGTYDGTATDVSETAARSRQNRQRRRAQRAAAAAQQSKDGRTVDFE